MKTLHVMNGTRKEKSPDPAVRLQQVIEEYGKRRPLYQDFAEVIRFILQEELHAKSIRVHSIEVRAKSIESFRRKISQVGETGPGEPAPKDPLAEITDLAGVRVITFFPRTLVEVDRILHEQFEVIEIDDKSEMLKEGDKFGYHSVHYLAKLLPNRTELAEYGRFTDLVAEIQVRTILQHAWAEIEHDIQYKSVEAMPAAVRRRFVMLAGLLELADREFQAIHDEDQKLSPPAVTGLPKER
jgi:ppGpp synthetase/RelA/SpoT-type nucleotidyltranferase